MQAVKGIQYPAGQRTAENAGNRNADHEQGIHAAAALHREPVRQIQHDAGKEAGFGYAKKKSDRIEHCRRGGEQRCRQKKRTYDHDSADPHARADTMHENKTKHNKKKKTKKKKTNTKPKNKFAELQ